MGQTNVKTSLLGLQIPCRRIDPLRSSEPSIRRLLQTIDAEIVDQVIYKWLATLCDSSAVAFDGKVLKGARNDDGTRVHLLSAVTSPRGNYHFTETDCIEEQ